MPTRLVSPSSSGPVLWMGYCCALGLLVPFPGARGYPTGAPESICFSMVPSHVSSSSSYIEPFNVTLSSITYSPLQPISVTIEPNLSGVYIRGFMIQARPANDRNSNTRLGFFQNSSGTKTVCSSGASTHSYSSDRLSVTVPWTAPAGPEGDIVFRATVVRRYFDYYMEIYSPVISYQAPTTNTTTPTTATISTTTTTTTKPPTTATTSTTTTTTLPPTTRTTTPPITTTTTTTALPTTTTSPPTTTTTTPPPSTSTTTPPPPTTPPPNTTTITTTSVSTTPTTPPPNTTTITTTSVSTTTRTTTTPTLATTTAEETMSLKPASTMVSSSVSPMTTDSGPTGTSSPQPSGSSTVSGSGATDLSTPATSAEMNTDPTSGVTAPSCNTFLRLLVLMVISMINTVYML